MTRSSSCNTAKATVTKLPPVLIVSCRTTSNLELSCHTTFLREVAAKTSSMGFSE